VKVRIRKTPVESEVDGMQLGRLAPGSVRDVSSSLASWLIVEGYAEPEMRRTSRDEDLDFMGAADQPHVVHDRRRRIP
jgi:hypothetical protein